MTSLEWYFRVWKRGFKSKSKEKRRLKNNISRPGLLEGGMFMKTKKTLGWLLSVVIVCSFLSLNALAQDYKSAQTRHEPSTQQLITMVEHN
jgi:hypothetical protein